MHTFLSSTWWRHQMEAFSASLAICAGNSPHKGQWRGALMFSLICIRINGWVNNREAGDLIRHRGHYVVLVMTRNDFHCPGHLSVEKLTTCSAWQQIKYQHSALLTFCEGATGFLPQPASNTENFHIVSWFTCNLAQRTLYRLYGIISIKETSFIW